MITRSEAPFTINGIKSSIHCLYQSTLKTSNNVPKVYHYHDYVELLYATDADTSIWINGEMYQFLTGDIAIINSNEPHAFTFKKASDYICIKFSPEILSADTDCMFKLQYVFPTLSKNLKKRVIKASELRDIDVDFLTKEIMNEWESEQTAHQLIIRADIMKIFTHIIRLWEKDNFFSFDSKPSEAMQKALTYISEKRACVNEEEVAAYCSLSTNYFSRTFKSTIGKNFKDYVCSLKLQNARNLLVTTDKSITEVAYDSGFSSTSHFISSFKKEFGQTPKQFQKILKSKI